MMSPRDALRSLAVGHIQCGCAAAGRLLYFARHRAYSDRRPVCSGQALPCSGRHPACAGQALIRPNLPGPASGLFRPGTDSA